MPKLGEADGCQQYKANNINKYLKEVDKIKKM